MMKTLGKTALLLLPALMAWLLGGCSMFGGGKSAALADNTRCPAAAQMQQAVDSEYGQRFMGRFSRQISYPKEALDAGQIGVVQLCARIGRDGTVREGRIDSGSGYPVLDGVALLALGQLKFAREAAEPMPKDFAKGQEAVWLDFPVNFTPETGSPSRYWKAREDRPCKDTGTREGDIEAQQVTLKEWGDFPGIFSDAVKKELIYPPQAQAAKESGNVLLCVSLDKDSHLLGASLTRSSGSALLDGASLIALGMMQLKYQMPPVPDRVRQAHERVTFTQEIEWKPGAVQ
jgi:TonB family protein